MRAALGRSRSERMVSVPIPPLPRAAARMPRPCLRCHFHVLHPLAALRAALPAHAVAEHAQGRPFLAIMGTLAAASLLAIVGLMASSSTSTTLLVPGPPSAVPSPQQVRTFARLLFDLRPCTCCACACSSCTCYSCACV